MSKSVYQILEHHTGAKSHNPHVVTAMDEYAAQAVSEYKEKLKAEIRKDIVYYESISLTDRGEGHLSGLKDIEQLINGPL